MKIKLIFLGLISAISYSQSPRAGGINNTQATVLSVVNDNFVGVQTTNSNAFAVYSFTTNFDYYLGLKSTDNLAEGITNKYFSSTLARNAFSAGTGLTYSAGIFGLDSSTQGLLASIANKVPNTLTINGQALSTNVVLGKIDVGLSNVDNTSDVNKPISALTQTALNGKLSTEVDGSITNEIQALSIAGNILSLSNGGGSATIPVNTYTAGTGVGIASNVVTNTAPDQTVTITSGNRISVTGTYPNFTIAYVEPSINIATRTLNSNFTVSTTKQAIVSYSVTCTVINPLLVGTTTATVFLEYSTNSGSTWVLPSQIGNSSAVGLTVTVQLTNGQTGTVVASVPANALVRIRTVNTTNASTTYVTGQEIY